MRFKKGQEVVCINQNGWCSSRTLRVCDGPAFNEICTVDGYERAGLIFLREYPIDEGFTESEFEPVVSITELESLLQEEPETITKELCETK